MLATLTAACSTTHIAHESATQNTLVARGETDAAYFIFDGPAAVRIPSRYPQAASSADILRAFLLMGPEDGNFFGLFTPSHELLCVAVESNGLYRQDGAEVRPHA